MEWGAPLNVSEDLLREAFKSELISLYGVEEANLRFVLDPLKIALYEYDNHLIPIDVDPSLILSFLPLKLLSAPIFPLRPL